MVLRETRTTVISLLTSFLELDLMDLRVQNNRRDNTEVSLLADIFLWIILFLAIRNVYIKRIHIS